MPADSVTLLAFAAERRAAVAPGGRRDRSTSPARRAHSSKPATVECRERMMAQRYRWMTDRRTPDR